MSFRSQSLHFVLVAISLATGAWAQSWPTKTVRIIVPNPAGGPVDVLAAVPDSVAVPVVIRLLMPYADRVFFRGLTLAGSGTLADWRPPAAPRYVA